MLVSNMPKHEVGDFRIFYLSMGIEVMGDIHSIDDEYVVINRPIRIVQTEQGTLPYPFSFAIEQDPKVDVLIPIRRDAIASIFPCGIDSLEKAYRQMRSSVQIVSGADATDILRN